VLLGAASLALTLSRPGRVDALHLAVALYLAAVGASLFVLAPRAGLRFSASALATIERLDGFRGEEAELLRRLVHELERLWVRNDRLVGWLLRAQRVSLVALVGEILTMSLGTATTIG
jgi:hypothetical protein